MSENKIKIGGNIIGEVLTELIVFKLVSVSGDK